MRTRGRRDAEGPMIRPLSRRCFGLSYRAGNLPATGPMARQAVLAGALPRGSALVLAEIPESEPTPRCLGLVLPDRVAPRPAPHPTAGGELVPIVAASIPHPGGMPTESGSPTACAGSVNRSGRTDRTRTECPQCADRRVPKNSLAGHAAKVAVPNPPVAHRDTPRRSAADPTRCARTGAPTDQVLGLPLTAAARRPAPPCPPSRRPPCTATS